MKKRFFLFLTVSLAYAFSMFGQNADIKHPDSLQHEITPPRLLITEFNFSQNGSAHHVYIEISNLEDSAVHLGDFSIHNIINNFLIRRDSEGYITSSGLDIDTRYCDPRNTYNRSFYFPDGDMIDAKSSVVIVNVYDNPLNILFPNTTKQPEALVAKGDYFVHWKEAANKYFDYLYDPANQAFGFDSISFNPEEQFADEFLRGANGPYILKYHYERTNALTGDAIPYALLVDQIALAERETQDGYVSQAWSVAGEPNHQEVLLARKSYITTPNLNWHIARGISAFDSEWMALPRPQNREPYTTVGNFGDYDVVVTPKSDKVSIDGNMITVPWEAKRFDDVIQNYVQLGDGMAFQYTKSPDRADSAFVRVCEGDTLTLYATGTELKIEYFEFKVADATDDVALAIPKVGTYLEIAPNGEELRFYNTGSHLLISDDNPTMDTISNVGYQAVIDSVLAYIEYPTKATAEYIAIDQDDDRSEVMMGDILRITAENGTTVKEYYIKPNEYSPSEDATLATLTFPEYENDDFYWEWEDATVPGFGPQKTFMVFKVAPDRNTIPALIATANNANATIEIDRAKNLVGSPEERTTTITVTAELDTISMVYKVQFEKEQDLSLLQPVEGAHPFISQIHRQPHNGGDYYLSLYNPNSAPIDMSDYMICSIELLDMTVESRLLYKVASDTLPKMHNDLYYYIPGYLYDYEKWKRGDRGFFKRDASVNTMVEANSEFVIGAYQPNGHHGEGDYDSLCNVNLWDPEILGDADGVDKNCYKHPYPYTHPKHYRSIFMANNLGFALFKIKNDSITEGTKIRKDLKDFELVDLYTKPQAGHPLYDFYKTYKGAKTMAMSGWYTQDAANDLGVPLQYGAMDFTSHTRLRRKSSVQKGATEYGQGFHWHKDSCDWMWECSRFEGWKNQDIRSTFHTHYMEPITTHLSSVSSSTYIVTPGYKADHNLEIKGVPASTSKEDFYSFINLADPGQTLTVYRGDQKLADGAVVESGDVLIVFATDSSATSEYTITTGSLNNNTDLTSVGSLGVEVNGNVISGFGYDATVADVLAGVEAHELSVIHVQDSEGTPVSLFTLRYEQELDEDNQPIYEYIDTKVFDGLQFEVVAENGEVKLYDIAPTVPEGDIFITSNNFTVVEGDIRYIEGVSPGLAVTSLLKYLNAPAGATIKIYNEAGYERTDGKVKWNDYAEVVSADGTLKAQYYIIVIGGDVQEILGDLTPVEKVLAGSLVKLYPNPAQGIVNLDNAPRGSVIQLISLSGSLVYSTANVTEKMSIPTSEFDSGMYFVRIVEKEGSSVHRLLIK